MAVPNPSNANPKKYLVVDDHAGFRKVLSDFLSGNGAEVVECSDGADSLAVFERENPDYVLMDIEMPVLDGLSATRSILSAHPGAHVVIVTQHDSLEMRQEARAAGARTFVLKDDLGQLREILGQALQ